METDRHPELGNEGLAHRPRRPAARATAADLPQERAAATLGDVLYANAAKARPSEQEWVALVRAVAGGDERALHALYERAGRIVFTLALRICRSREAAEEVTLDVFHDVWRRAAAYNVENGTVLGWIMNQARSRAIDRVRFEQRKKRLQPDSGDPLPPAEAADVALAVELKQRGEALELALIKLTPDERQAIEAAFFAGLSHAEAAARLSVPLGTVKTRIRSALKKLRGALAPEADRS